GTGKKFWGVGRQGRDQMRMGRAKSIDRHTGSKVEIAFAVGHEQPCSLAALKGQVDSRIGWQQVRSHEAARSNGRPRPALSQRGRGRKREGAEKRKMKCAASQGGTGDNVLRAC